jgi:uncharacterized protein (TIGR04222 family)
MDFLFDNPLANMPGVTFLIFYVLYSVFALVIFGVWKKSVDQTDQLAIPPIPPNIDPYEIAFLRGGINETARSVTFSLRQKGFLIFQNDDKNSRIHRDQNQNDTSHLSQIEQAALSWFSISREPKDVFRRGGLIEVIKPFAEAYEARLEQQQLLTDSQTKSRISKAKWILLAAIVGLGFYKFIAALLGGYLNFIGIFVVLAFATFFAFAVSKTERLTKLGKAYLERLQLAFSQLKSQAQTAYQNAEAPRPVAGATFAGVDPMLLGVGVFGATILAGTMYNDYNTAFQRAQNQSGGSSCGSACGSSCSSGSSGDGGSSSCSSGCGGCGGGGCS